MVKTTLYCYLKQKFARTNVNLNALYKALSFSTYILFIKMVLYYNTY